MIQTLSVTDAEVEVTEGENLKQKVLKIIKEKGAPVEVLEDGTLKEASTHVWATNLSRPGNLLVHFSPKDPGHDEKPEPQYKNKDQVMG